MKKLLVLLFILSSSTFGKSVVSTLPSITEIIYHLQGEKKLLAVTPFCNYPAVAGEKEKIGSAFSLNIEKIAKIKPDLVFLAPVKGGKNQENLTKLGIPFKEIPYESVSDIIEGMKIINKEMGLGKSDLIDKFELNFKAVPSNENAKNVLIIITETIENGLVKNVRVAGVNTFYSDLLTILGHKNIVKSNVKFPVWDLERLVKKKPDIVLRIGSNFSEKKIRNEWKDIKLFKNMKFILNDYAVVPGPRIISLLRDMREKLK